MFKKTSQKRVQFQRSLTSLVTGVFAIAAILYGGFVVSPEKAIAASASTVNFQARLQTAAGAIVPDGYYNVEFKLYGADTGGSALWTETYYDTNGATAGNDYRVRVVNGYLSVALGSQTAFPATINWDQELWLTMNIGGTAQSATPTYDGEMNPRLKLTATPFALSAGQLQTTNGANTSKLSLQTPTGGSQNFVIPDQGVAGTYNLLTNKSGVQLQGVSPGTAQTGSYNISGTGIAGILQASTFDTATAGALGIGMTNATSILLNQNVTVAADKSLNVSGASATTILFGSQVTGDANQRFTISADGTLRWGGGTSGVDVALGRATGGALSTSQNLSVGTTSVFNSKLSVQAGASTAQAIVARGAASQSVNILEIRNSSDRTQASFSAGGNQLALGRISGDTNSSAGSIKFGDGSTTNSYGVTLQSSTLGANRTLNLPDADGTLAVTTDTTNFIRNQTTQQSGNINIVSAASGNVGAVIQGVTGQSVDILQIKSSGGVNSLRVSNNGTVSSTVAINTAVGFTVNGATSQSGDLFRLQDSSANVHASFNSVGNQLSLGRAAASGTVSQGKIVLADGTTSNFGLTLQSNTLTANRTLTLPDETGTVLTDQSGIKLQSSTPGTAQTGNFRISGTGIAGALQAASLDVSAAGTLSIGTATSTGITIGSASAAVTLNGNLISNGSQLNTAMALSNFASGGAIGTAAATVDIKTSFTINQTTAGQSLTVPNPTVTTAGRVIYVLNIGSVSFNLIGSPLATGAAATLVWNGSAWVFSGADANSILNQNASAQTGNFRINGTGLAGSLQATSFDTSAAGLLSLGTANATSLALGNTGVTSATIQVGTNSGFAVNQGAIAVFSIGNGGKATFMPSTDAVDIFRVQNAAGSTLFNVDSTTSTVSTCASCILQAGNGGIATTGTLSFSGTASTNYTTPLGASIGTKINIANYNPGNFGQILAMGLASSAPSTARVITIADARSGAHQPSIAVLSPDETQIGGFSWDGSNSTFNLKTSSSTIGLLNSGGTPIIVTASGSAQTIQVGVNTGAANTLQFGGNGTNTGSNSGSTVALQGGQTAQMIANSGVTVRTFTDSSTAFQIQNSSAAALFTVDTNGGTLTIGNSGNTVTFASTGEMTLAGTARHTKSIVLTPEYAGAVLDATNDSACSSAYNGTMTSGYQSGISGFGNATQNYYKWTSAQSSTQCYDVVAQVPVPSDWAAWTSSPLTMNGYVTSTANGGLKATVYDSGGYLDTNWNVRSVTPGSASAWTTSSSAAFTGSNYTAGSYMTVIVRMESKSNADTRLGNITLNYYSKY